MYPQGSLRVRAWCVDSLSAVFCISYPQVPWVKQCSFLKKLNLNFNKLCNFKFNSVFFGWSCGSVELIDFLNWCRVLVQFVKLGLFCIVISCTSGSPLVFVTAQSRFTVSSLVALPLPPCFGFGCLVLILVCDGSIFFVFFFLFFLVLVWGSLMSPFSLVFVGFGLFGFVFFWFWFWFGSLMGPFSLCFFFVLVFLVLFFLGFGFVRIFCFWFRLPLLRRQFADGMRCEEMFSQMGCIVKDILSRQLALLWYWKWFLLMKYFWCKDKLRTVPSWSVLGGWPYI